MKLSEALKRRILSFVWRLGGVMAVAGLNWVSQESGNWSLGPEWVMVIGLVVGEVTKFINVNLPKID